MLGGWISFQTTHLTDLEWYLIPPLPYTDFSNLGWARKRINQSRDFLCPWGGNGFRMPPRRVRRRLISIQGGLMFFWKVLIPKSWFALYLSILQACKFTSPRFLTYFPRPKFWRWYATYGNWCKRQFHGLTHHSAWRGDSISFQVPLANCHHSVL